MAATDSIHHWEHGDRDAPVLLCLHGIGSCADAFFPQQELAETCGRRVVAWDAPGYRHSPDPATEPGLDGWADAAAAFITALGADQADVLGVSWGGVIATRLALRHPGVIRSLILADSSVGAGTSPRRAEEMRARASEMVDAGLEEFAVTRSPKLVAASCPQGLIDEVAQLMIDSVRMPSYEWAGNSMAEADHRPELSSISAPTLVIVGDEDIITGPRAAQALADGIDGARLVTITQAGHLANQERPAAFNAAVAEFLKR